MDTTTLIVTILAVATALIAAVAAIRALLSKDKEARTWRSMNSSRSMNPDEEQPEQRKRVAVVGGGLAGLVSSKRMMDEGMEVVGFERADQLGGLWVYRPGADGKTYLSLRANVHKERLEMECFPMPESWPKYPSHWMLCEYLQAFAKHFGLPDVYKMSTEVVACRCSDEEDGGWVVTYRPVGGDEAQNQEVHVDAVCMCVGQTCTPLIPQYEGLDTFQGEITHSSQYRNQASYHGKRVLVVGAGAASGTDLAQDLSFGAKQVFLSVRRGIILLPRFLGGKPNAAWHESVFWNYVPLAWLLRLMTVSLHMLVAETFGTGSAEYHGIKGPTVMETIKTRLCELRLSDIMTTDCCNLTQRVAMGAVKMKPAIESFTETTVRFVDGSAHEIDAVVWATGFRRNVTNLGCSVGRAADGDTAPAKLRLWKCVFHPSLPNFACCLQTHPYGSHWAVADVQARWIAEVFSGKVGLPDQKTMEKEASELAEEQRLDTCLDTAEVWKTAKYMGLAQPGPCGLLASLITKPIRTCRWLGQNKVHRRLTIDECAKPYDKTCKYQTAL